MAYKVYFKEDKFVVNKTPCAMENGTDMVRYEESMERAVRLVELLNGHRKESLEELKDRYDYVIRYCRDCNRPFMLRKSELDWFHRKGANLPVRCPKCRKKKHRKHFSKTVDNF